MVVGFIEPNYASGSSKKSGRMRRHRERLFKEQDGKCYWCHKPMEMEQLRKTKSENMKSNPMFASFEHLLPKSHGGIGGPANLVLAHISCNNRRHKRKWDHDPVYGKKRPREEWAAKKIETPKTKPIPYALTMRFLRGEITSKQAAALAASEQQERVVKEFIQRGDEFLARTETGESS